MKRIVIWLEMLWSVLFVFWLTDKLWNGSLSNTTVLFLSHQSQKLVNW